MTQKVLTLENGKKKLIDLQNQGLGFCDISLFVVGLFEVLLTDLFSENLSDQNGIPIGYGFAMMPNQCLNEYNSGLSDQDKKYIFGTEGEMLI